MSADEHLADSALGLPVRERARLAARLLESLEEGDTDDDTEAFWEAEIIARLQRLTGGRATTVTSDEAFREARARLVDRR